MSSDELKHQYSFDGWTCLGRFPDEEDGVGSWILSQNGEAVLWELPSGLTYERVQQECDRLGVKLKWYGVSHYHEDHCDIDLDRTLRNAAIEFIPNLFMFSICTDMELTLGGEPLYVLCASKHSKYDFIVVFKGVAMTGDVELQQLESVNREVNKPTKKESMKWWSEFESRNWYKVHTTISAHLNDKKTNVNWRSLFSY